MPMGSSRTQNRTFGRRGKAHLETRQRSAPLRRMSSAEEALSQALFSVPSSALIRTSSFGDSDVVARLRSNSSRRESMAAPPKMETDDADKEGEGATRERSTSLAMTDGAAFVLKKHTLSNEQPPLLLQQADGRSMGGAHDGVPVEGELLAPSPPQQQDTHEGEDPEEEAVVLQEHDTIERRRDAEGAGMAGGYDDVLIAHVEPQEDGRAEEEQEQEELPPPGQVGGGREGVIEGHGEHDAAAVEVAPQLQAQVYVELELEVQGERASVDVHIPLAPQQLHPQRINVMNAEPEVGDVEGGVEEPAAVHADMRLAPPPQEQDLDAGVAVQLEMIEEGGGGGRGEPVCVHERETVLTPPMQQQQQGVQVGTRSSVEVEERGGHLGAELGKKGMSSALVVYITRRRTTRTPARGAAKHTPIVRLCLRVLTDITATVGGSSLRRGALWMMGGDSSAFAPYLRRRPLTVTYHEPTAITASPPATYTTPTNAPTTTVIEASSSSPPRASSAHVSFTSTTVFTITPASARARHQRSKTRAAVSAATGAGDLLIDQWRPYALPDLTNPAITTTTTTTTTPSVINRHVGRCAWMEEVGGGDWGLERLLRERRPGLLQGMQSSLRRMRDRMTSAAVTTASSSRNTHTHESDSTGGGGDEAADAVAAVGCWSFLRGTRSRSSNRKA